MHKIVSKLPGHFGHRLLLALTAALLWIVAGSHAFAAEQQRRFASPEEAAQALVAAIRSQDLKALTNVLGPGSDEIVESGDAVADKARRARFVKAYEESNKLVRVGDAKAVLNVGKDDWPFPVPIVKDGKAWRFDTTEGKEEILNRRIGRNELAVVQVLQAYVDAQREYYLRNPQGDKLLQYAQRIASSEGKRDGLYFPTKGGERQSPLGPLVESAKAVGYTKAKGGEPTPYYGYYYRILTSQGPEARGGTYDYVVQGKMIGGFALVAWPASYGNSGVMTFIVNHDGVVYEKDLGPDTASAVRKIATFNPDRSWKRQ
jgi:hypothetical protein